jgi:hypothetical protein
VLQAFLKLSDERLLLQQVVTYADVCWRMLTYADVCWRIGAVWRAPLAAAGAC